jgi:CheY-like chemotaxis protein
VKLFTDFTEAGPSTTRKFSGTGLGLTLTRRFCEMMGGEVNVSSIPGEGNVFIIKLPAVVGGRTSGAAAVNAGGQSVTAPQYEGGLDGTEPGSPTASRVLVIHDDRTQRDVIRRFLIKEGFCVYAAASGEEGLRLARQSPPVAIILDVMMLDMEGWRVLLALKADPEMRDIPVIMMTMVSELECGFTLGAADIATKPIDRARLSQILMKYACPHPPCSVLLVEDNPATREVTRAMLEKEGWKVREAENGRVALDCIERERPSLILLDLMMPEMDGFEFTVRMRRHPEWRSIPIVVLTARDLSGDERRRLNGCVETVLQQAGASCETMLHQLCELLDDYPATRAMTMLERNERKGYAPLRT